MKPDVDVLWPAGRAREEGEEGGGEDRADASYCWNAVATCGRKGKDGGKEGGGSVCVVVEGSAGFPSASAVVAAAASRCLTLLPPAAGHWPLTAAD